MSHHRHRPNKLDEEILQREDMILLELEELRHDQNRITRSVANIFSGDFKMANNVLVLNAGQTSTDTITPFLTDGVTPSGGVVSNLAVTFSDPSATAVVSGPDTVLFTGVAASTGAISGSTSFTITDTDGVVSQWTVPFTVTTNGVTPTPPPPPTQLTQSAANVFSTPV